MTLRTVYEVLEEPSWTSTVGIAIPPTSGLMDFNLDYFPAFFRGWMSSRFPDQPAPTVELVDFSDEAIDGLDLCNIPFMTVFFLDGCSLEILQDFAHQYEVRTNCAPGSEEELTVMDLTTMRNQVLQNVKET